MRISNDAIGNTLAHLLKISIEAAVKFQLGRDGVDGLRVAIQGVGNVGYYLSKYLSEAGAELVVADIDGDRVKTACEEFGAREVPWREILFQDVDVVAPCALGAVLTSETIPRLKARIVAGGANNQLATDADGKRLSDAGILYAPDYVINGGGIINVACEYYGGVDDSEVLQQVAAIGPRLTRIFEEARDSGQPTNVIADNQARQIISDAAEAGASAG